MLLNSPTTVAFSATAFRTVPPSMVPQLKVVSASRRPWGSLVTISAATRIADRPLLRLDAGVGGPPRDLDLVADVGWGCRGDAARGTLTVEDDGLPGGYQGEVQFPGAQQPGLLGAGEAHLDGDVADAVLPDRLDGLENGRESRLAVAPQYGGAIGHDAVALDPWLDAPARLDGVHVGREQQRALTALVGDEVAEVVGLYRQPQRLETARQVDRDLVLLTGRAVDTDQLAEGLDQSVSVDHSCPP